MTALFLTALVLAWIALFVPAIVRASKRSPLSTAERFRRRLDLIAPRYAQGRWVVMPDCDDRLARKSWRKGQRLRRRIFGFLVAAVVVSGVLVIFYGSAMWSIHIAFDASLGLFVALLLFAKRRREGGARISRARREAHADTRLDQQGGVYGVRRV